MDRQPAEGRFFASMREQKQKVGQSMRSREKRASLMHERNIIVTTVWHGWTG